jgi:hypothetical protein
MSGPLFLIAASCRTQALVNRSQALVNRTQAFVNRTQALVNRTQALVNRTQALVNHTQVCVNLVHVRHHRGVRLPRELALLLVRQPRVVVLRSTGWVV